MQIFEMWGLLALCTHIVQNLFTPQSLLFLHLREESAFLLAFLAGL
jgi:hypothetical protein